MLSHEGSAVSVGSSIYAAIPARFGSERFPGKPLALLHGQPLIRRVWERVCAANCFERIVVLTDDARILEAVLGFGGDVEMTPTDVASGTDRIAWAARSWNCRAIVNVQGDEPLVAPEDLVRVARRLERHPDDAIVTLATEADAEDLANPHAVKVVLAADGRALYFSRSPIPYRRSAAPVPVWKHVGVYGYRRDVLLQLAALAQTPLERAEGLEQLRALEHGIPIRVLTGARPSQGVDTPADLEAVARQLEHAFSGVQG